MGFVGIETPVPEPSIVYRNTTEVTTMAEDEVQAQRDWFVQLCRKLETEKGLSRLEATRHVLAMADQEKLLDWLVQDLEKATPQDRAAFVQKVLAMTGADIDDLDDDDTNEPQSH
jgi:hypothetical protein